MTHTTIHHTDGVTFENIVFIQGEDDDNTVDKLYNRESPDSIVYHGPTAESIDAAFEYLSQWDYEPTGDIRENAGSGSSDDVWEQGQYRMSAHNGLTYVGLERVILPEEYVTAFTQAYARALLWANTTVYNPDTNEPTGQDVTPEDWQDGGDLWALDAFVAASRADVEKVCSEFCEANSADLQYVEPAQAGHDFLLTRSGHGSGYWEYGTGLIGDRMDGIGQRLSKAAKIYGDTGASMPADADGACVTLDSFDH